MERAAYGTPLYVHLPFCAAKCHYCDFFSLPVEGHDVGAMVGSILAEARARAPRGPRTVFLGGGTPSLLEPAQLGRLLDGLEEITGFRGSAVEVSAECNPESLDQDKAVRMLELGVTRLTLGFQALRDEVLASFGRVHSVSQSWKAYEAARSAGVREIGIDLIYAYPGQSVADWEEDLAKVLELEPEHLSAYNLAFEEGTAFTRWLAEGRMEKTPEEVELELMGSTRALTEAAGLEAYEVSNFARNGHECRHNINYWQNGDYVGIGPSAVSRVGFERSGNVRGVAAYARAVEAGERPMVWSEVPEPEKRLGESWWLGLRLGAGLDPAAARAAAGWPEGWADPALPVARRLEQLGLLERAGRGWRMTPAGLPVADALAREFLDLHPLERHPLGRHREGVAEGVPARDA